MLKEREEERSACYLLRNTWYVSVLEGREELACYLVTQMFCKLVCDVKRESRGRVSSSVS